MPPDLRTPRQVLPGHWRNLSGRLHYYIAADRLTLIEAGRTVAVYPFEIVEENVAENWIRIQLQADDAALRTLRIDFQRQGFLETFEYRGVVIHNIMLHADAAQTPP